MAKTTIVSKQWVNPTFENKCELKMFKACTMYPKVMPFGIYTTVSFFKKPSPLSPCVCLLKKKKKHSILN